FQLLSLLFGESDSIRAIAWQRTDLLAEGYQKEDPRCSKLYVTVFKKQGTKPGLMGRSPFLDDIDRQASRLHPNEPYRLIPSRQQFLRTSMNLGLAPERTK